RDGDPLPDSATAYANPGNRNNEIGLPLAVIDQPEDARYAIYEMGAGQPGDIAYLTDVVAPHAALVNNVAAAHLERMGSLLGVAETKGAIYAALRAGGTPSSTPTTPSHRGSRTWSPAPMPAPPPPVLHRMSQ